MRQEWTWRQIATCLAHGHDPSWRDLAHAASLSMGVTISTGPIAKHVHALAKKGYLAFTPRMARTIRLLKWPDGIARPDPPPLDPASRPWWNALTPTQQGAVLAVVELYRETGRYPTCAELGRKLGINRSAACQLMAACKRKGAVTLDSRAARSLRLV